MIINMEKREGTIKKQRLMNYLEMYVEPTLAYFHLLYLQGALNTEQYINAVASLTEIFSYYGKAEEEYLDKLYDYYAEELLQEEVWD